jgi:hypothetical protein
MPRSKTKKWHNKAEAENCIYSEEIDMFTEFMRDVSARSVVTQVPASSPRADTRTWRRKRRSARLARVPLAA